MSGYSLRSAVVVAALLALGAGAGAGAARADDPALLCEALAAQAGAEAGLPPGLMPAIARVESGRGSQHGVRAWPWTLNQGGKGSYHPTRAAALTHLQGILASGIRNVDLGCMQLNWRWHATAFPDAATMIDPVANTRYAARFLRDLHARHGSWAQAVAHYHSADPTRGAAYAAKVAAKLDQIGTSHIVTDADMDTDTDPHTGTCGVAAVTGVTAYRDQGGDCPRVRGLLVMAQGGLVGGPLGRPSSGLMGAAKGRDLRVSDHPDTAPVHE